MLKRGLECLTVLNIKLGDYMMKFQINDIIVDDLYDSYLVVCVDDEYYTLADPDTLETLRVRKGKVETIYTLKERPYTIDLESLYEFDWEFDCNEELFYFKSTNQGITIKVFNDDYISVDGVEVGMYINYYNQLKDHLIIRKLTKLGVN